MLGFEMNSQVVYVLVAAAAILLMMRGITMRVRGKSRLSQEEAEARIPSLRSQVEVKENLQRLLVDLQDLARQINGHIDTRFCKLEVLIKEADAKIRQLETMGFGGTGARDAGSNSESLQADPERELIYKLADSGKGPVDIARELNKNTGEIELILSLRRSRNAGGNKIDYRIG